MPPEVIDSIRRCHSRDLRPDDAELFAELDLRPVAGGLNNQAYTFRHAGRRLLAKCHRVDGRRREEREWAALQLLAECAGETDFAPQPVHYAPHPEMPVVVMTHLPGEHLGDRRLSHAQLAALAKALQHLHQITPETTSRRHPLADGNVFTILDRLQADLDVLPARPPSLHHAAARALWRAWLAGPDPAALIAPAPLHFYRGDPALANCLWDGARVRIVDFEYSGWNDRAVELADLIEHPQSRATPDDGWAWFVERFDLTPAELARLTAARRMFAVFWIMKHWPFSLQSSEAAWSARFEAQVQRAEAMTRA